jgi:SAM-dependent methyltransferase
MTEDERGMLRLALFDQLLSLIPPGRCIDLGAGHGKFSHRAAERGWDVVAVDARPERFPFSAKIEFIQADIREVDLTGYDLILCLGLFYHLTLVDQIDLLDAATGTPIMIDTHLATGRYGDSDALSPLQVVDAYEGVSYREGDRDDLLASWGNAQSFWHTPESFSRLVSDHGYPITLNADPWVSPDRRFSLSLPQGWVPLSSSGRGQAKLLARSIRRRLPLPAKSDLPVTS